MKENERQPDLEEFKLSLPIDFNPSSEERTRRAKCIKGSWVKEGFQRSIL